MWKRFVNDYLNYTGKERKGIIALLTLIAFFILVPFLYPLLFPEKRYDFKKFADEIAQLEIVKQDSFSNKKFYAKNDDDENFADYASPSEKNSYSKTSVEVFYFDPNTATPNDWKRLGIKDRTIETIQKYLSKGGHFYKPENISKIWGLRPEDIKRLLPYVSIAAKKNAYPANQTLYSSTEKKFTSTPKILQPIDINSADTSALIALPGIGSKLALRIINFRNKVGGFYAIDQVAETFGLPDSTFQKIRNRLTITNTSIKKININAATIDELKSHPYIRYAVGNAIIQYRSQHGNFSSIAELKNIMIITDEIYKKMEKYVSAE